MRLLTDSIGRKMVMAVTGLLMVAFVIAHMLGNLTVFAGPNGINAYAAHLHALEPLVWLARVIMLAAVSLHIFFAIQITLENRDAKPTKYAVSRSLKATFAGRNMIWTGLILGAFIIYHLLHFTVRVTPDLVLGNDSLNRFDVYSMVVNAFHHVFIALAYVVAVVSLFMHLSHGIQSLFQTLGLSSDRLQPKLVAGGSWLSVILLLGFGAIPVLIFAGAVAAK